MRSSRKLLAFEILIVFLTMPLAVSALDPHRTMSQYFRDRWPTEDGFPGGQVSAIAQTPDGYLWIAGEKGLVRFDGLSFRLVKESSKSTPIRHVLGLTTDAEGGLWIWMQGANVLRYHAGSFDNVTSGSALPDLSITAMSPTLDGGILLSTIGQDTFQYNRGSVSKVAWTNLPDTLILSNAKTSDGKIWIGTRDTGLFYLEAGKVTPVLHGLTSRKVNCLLPGRLNELWIGTEDGLLFWDGTKVSMESVPLSLRQKEILAITTDRDGNLWVATARGLSRLVTSRIRTTEITMPGITALFEDREGSLWIGSPQGLQRWRDGTFLGHATGFGSPSLGSSGPVFADAAGRVWFGPAQGGLYSVEHGTATQWKAAGIGSDIVYSLSGLGSSLWIGRQRGGLTHLFSHANTLVSKTYTQANGLAQNSVYAVHESQDGTVWAGTLSAGLSRLKDGLWTTYTTADGLSSNTITAVEEDANHNLWVATPSGLNERIDGHWRTYLIQNGLPSDEITCLLPDDAGADTKAIWVGTANGLALLTPANIRSFAPRLTPISEVLQEPILGIAADQSGFLWITTPDHIMKLSRHKLLDGTLSAADIREYTRSDGLPALEGVRRSRSVIRDEEGRIWISTRDGLVTTAPTSLQRPAAPSVIQLEAILADGVPIDLRRTQIPASQHRIVFEFAAVSLTAPERLQYRYRLDGFDMGWSEPTSAREAAYTHLDPGSYRFHVVASNTDGVWSEVESSQGFVIEPAFWQTNWFRLCCLAALLLLASFAYLLRARQLATQMHLRYEERLAERMRIAQDLHDTLLQGFLSASMQLDVATDHVAKDSPAAPMLSRVLALMRQGSEDCRRALTQLRSGERHNPSLEGAFSFLPQELGLETQTIYRVIVNGTPRPLEPSFTEEIFLIGREAVVNAYRHAGATLIEVELAYERASLHVFIRDDGRGIDPLVVRSGKHGHWGLTGMRERAVKLGAQFKIWSRPLKGTEVEIIAPGEVAFLHRIKRTYRNRLRARFASNGDKTVAEKEVR